MDKILKDSLCEENGILGELRGYLAEKDTKYARNSKVSAVPRNELLRFGAGEGRRNLAYQSINKEQL